MNKTIDIIRTIFTWLIVLITVFMMIFTIVSVCTFDRNDRNIFGYKAFIVLSDSMSATDFSAGDVVIVKSVDPTTLVPGDIICYTSQNTESYGENVTHKIRSLTTDANGDPGFITYGTTTDTDDEIVVTYPFVNGKYQFRLPKVGTFFQFLKTTPGYICCILIPFLILIGLQGYNTIQVFRQYKKEQTEALEAERAAIESERAQTQDMMRELLALKQQLAAQQEGGGAAAPVAAAAPAAEAAPVEAAPVEAAPVEAAPVEEAAAEGVSVEQILAENASEEE